MSSDVWKIAQNTDANFVYETSSYYSGLFGLRKNELNGLKKITSMCLEMTANFEEVIQDQNKYIIEFENLEMEYLQNQENIENEINRLLAEIKALEMKEQNGTITEDEQKELSAKKDRLNSLYSGYSENKKDKQAELAESKAQIKNEYGQKEKIAHNYGNLAIEKGNSFIDEELDKKLKEGETISAFKYVFNGKLDRHLNGKTAIAAGDALLDKVEESSLVDNKITFRKVK